MSFIYLSSASIKNFIFQITNLGEIDDRANHPPIFRGVYDLFTPFFFTFLPQLNACFRIASNIKVAFDMKSRFGGDGFRHPFPCILSLCCTHFGARFCFDHSIEKLSIFFAVLTSRCLIHSWTCFFCIGAVHFHALGAACI